MRLSLRVLSTFFFLNWKVSKIQRGLKNCIYRELKASPPLEWSKAKAINFSQLTGLGLILL